MERRGFLKALAGFVGIAMTGVPAKEGLDYLTGVAEWYLPNTAEPSVLWVSSFDSM